jgi:hypothetical protein
VSSNTEDVSIEDLLMFLVKLPSKLNKIENGPINDSLGLRYRVSPAAVALLETDRRDESSRRSLASVFRNS